MDFFINRIKGLRRQVLICVDLLIVSCVYLGLFLVFYYLHGAIPEEYLKNLFILLAVVLISFIGFRTYDSLWRYAKLEEYLRLSVAMIAATGVYALCSRYLLGNTVSGFFSLSVMSLSLTGMVTARFLYREYRRKRTKFSGGQAVRLAIVGAGLAGDALLEEIQNHSNNRYVPVCMIDDDREKVGRRVHQVPVVGDISHLAEICEERSIEEIIIAIPSASAEEKKRIIEYCSQTTCRVKILPDTFNLILNDAIGNLYSSVREVNIEDLLGRPAVQFEETGLSFLEGEVVLVTGGGGSIGSELCRQIARAKPKKLIILDIYENNAYDLQQELLLKYKKRLDLVVEIASVRDVSKIDRIFRNHRPSIVFHAAAHKHVPLMENNPDEAIKNNVFGTFHVVMMADRYEVKKFVLVSTDKAVNPTNIMGATKRFAEMILQSMKNVSTTEFAAVRFGNVLNSNGSVIPLFRRQISNGGPVTVTHEDIIRYFMTIPEAAQLVLQAGAMAKGAEVFVLDMGEPMKIRELAENLIRLSGYIPYKDIDIQFSGLRPGEKLYEELLMAGEELSATSNHKIYIEKQNEITCEEISEKLSIIRSALNSGDHDLIRAAMREVIPTFKTPDEVNQKEFHLDYSEVKQQSEVAENAPVLV